MNLNELAKEVAMLEGKEQELSIAQIKEVMHCLGYVLSDMPIEMALVLVSKMIAKGAKH